MPRINTEISEETAQKARVVKAYLDITWPEFIDEAADCLHEKHDIELTGVGGGAMAEPDEDKPKLGEILNSEEDSDQES